MHGARRQIVRIGRHERVGGPRRALHGFALAVEVVHLFLRRDRLDPVVAVAERSEVAVMQQVHRMAVGADLLVDLKAALQGGAVERAEDAVERPAGVRQRRGRRLLREGRKRGKRERQGCGEAAHQCFSPALAGDGASVPPCFASTDAAMLVGSGSGRSNFPMSGMST